MNIVMLQHTFNPTTMGWVRGLESRGHRVLTLVARDTEPFGGWAADLQVVVVPDSVNWLGRVAALLFPGRRPAVFGVPRMRHLRRALVEFDADAVLVKIYSLRNVMALLVALSLGVRRVAWIEQVPPPNLEWRILRRIGVLPRRVFTALDARPGGLAAPLDPPAAGYPVITYAPIVPAEGSREPIADRPVRILTAAAFWSPEGKRPFWTLEAARDAGLLDGRCRFTFTGIGKVTGARDSGGHGKFRSQRILAELIEDLGIAHLVDVRVNVPYLGMPAVYDEHDVLVLPSAREQFGMVVPEAMAHGLAVVASDCVGSRGCIVPGVTGMLFDTQDRDDLSRTLRELVEHPERIEAMGAAGRDLIVQHASPQVTALRLEALLER